jgi:mono/diheme cytochrome c family protein
MCPTRPPRTLQVRSRGSLGWASLPALCSLGLLVACRQQMADQPRNGPLTASTFFKDGMSARPLVKGSVPRGSVEEDSFNLPVRTDTFPVPVTQALLDRGQERFAIFCSPCHGLAGDGDGMIVRRGFPQPPSYHIDRLRMAPLGHFYDVITHGYGQMPSYASQITPRDRWAVIAYIRALQFSQHAPVSELSASARSHLDALKTP